MAGRVKKTRNDALGAALLLLVVAVHYGYDPLATWLYTHDPQQASKAIFYVFRGIEGAAAWLALLAFAGERRTWLLTLACCIGAVESAQTAICRLAFPIAGSPPLVPAGGGLCSAGGGLPFMTVSAVVLLMLACIALEKLNESAGPE